MDVPGSINDEWNVQTCRLLHNRGMNTHLLSLSKISSGGVDLFISGNQRTIEDGAQVGVHSWSEGNKDGADYPKNSVEHQMFLDFFDATILKFPRSLKFFLNNYWSEFFVKNIFHN